VRTRLIIGITEFVDLPDWNIRRLRVKVDTGARTSALHVENVHLLGRDRVRFDVRLHREKPTRRASVEAKITRRAWVRTSTGVAEPRLFVTTRLRLGPVEREVELGLVDRRNMIFRMLLGRSALGSSFLVDVARRFVLSGPARKPRPRARSGAARGAFGSEP
jgi:hypothetical protein